VDFGEGCGAHYTLGAVLLRLRSAVLQLEMGDSMERAGTGHELARSLLRKDGRAPLPGRCLSRYGLALRDLVQDATSMGDMDGDGESLELGCSAEGRAEGPAIGRALPSGRARPGSMESGGGT